MKNLKKVARQLVMGMSSQQPMCTITAWLLLNYYVIPFRPYDGRWSKTMIGYGKEQSYFVLELTYNYGIKSYKLGNDFQVGLLRLISQQ